jgi:hypothetical protein
MNITYRMTPDDLIAFNIYSASNSPTIRAQHRNSRIIATIIPAVLILILTDYSNETINIYTFLFPLLASIVTFFVYNPIANHNQRKVLDKVIKSESSKQFFAERTVTLYPEHIQTISEMEENTMQWGTIKDVKIVPDYVYLFIDTVHAIIIPKRAFPNELAFEEFTQEAVRLQQNAAKIHATL